MIKNANFTSSYFFPVQSVAWCACFQEEAMPRVPQTGWCWSCSIAMTAMHLGNVGSRVCQWFPLSCQVLDSSKDISPAAPLACDGLLAPADIIRYVTQLRWHICGWKSAIVIGTPPYDILLHVTQALAKNQVVQLGSWVSTCNSSWHIHHNCCL